MEVSQHKGSQGVYIRSGEPRPRAADGPPAVPLRVVMLVATSCINDGRVIKEAETLTAAGHMVRVVCRETEGAPDREIINGVEYLRVKWPRDLSKLREVFANRRRYRSSLERKASVSLFVASLVVDLAIIVLRALRTTFRSVRRALKTKVRSVRRLVGSFLVQLLQFSLTRLAISDAASEWQPDVIHAHDLITLPAAVKTARRLGARVVADLHELEEHRNPPKSWFWRLWTRYHERRYIPQADEVIVVSNSAAQYLADSCKIEPPLVIFNAPEVSSERSSQRDVRRDLGLSSSTPLAVYVGGIGINRGVDQLVRALRDLPDFHLALVGPRKAQHEETIRALAREFGHDDRIHILDPVPYQEVVPYISSADIGVYALQNVCLNHDYAMPNKIFEMTLAGLPVAVSNLTDMGRFIRYTGTGLTMDETDPRDIVRVMKDVYERRDELRPSPSRLLELTTEFSWRAQGKNLANLYNELALSRSMLKHDVTSIKTQPNAPVK